MQRTFECQRAFQGAKPPLGVEPQNVALYVEFDELNDPGRPQQIKHPEQYSGAGEGEKAA